MARRRVWGWLMRAGLCVATAAWLPTGAQAQGARAAASAPASAAAARPAASAATPAAVPTAVPAGAGTGAQPRRGAEAPTERAQRAADSPMRAILEAARLRRRGEAEPPGEADPAGRRATATPPPARAAAAADPVRAEARPVPTAPAAAGNATGPAAVARESEVVTIRTLPTEPAVAGSAGVGATPLAPLARAAPAASAVAELPRVPALPEVAAGVRPSGSASGTGAPAGAATATAPQLLHMIEPELGPRMLEQLARPEVSVQFTIRADGAVEAVQVLPPVPRQVVPLIVGAVEQWRFAPLPAPRQHRVQLVFRPGP